MDSSDFYAIPVNDKVHHDFMKLHDAILVVSSSPKSLSSSSGHELMSTHPFSVVRVNQALTNIQGTLDALYSGDLDKLAVISENEALTLHSLIMTSTGGTILLEPDSLMIIKMVRQARQRGLPVFFSLDAGPNIHLLYPDKNSEDVEHFIREELTQLCENGKIIFDQCGDGPVQIKTEQHPDP
jgi:diphosphomevalonate decarboxylase